MPAKYSLDTVGTNKFPFFTIFIHGSLTVAPRIAVQRVELNSFGQPSLANVFSRSWMKAAAGSTSAASINNCFACKTSPDSISASARA